MIDHVAVRRGKFIVVADEGFRQPVELPRSSETFWSRDRDGGGTLKPKRATGNEINGTRTTSV